MSGEREGLDAADEVDAPNPAPTADLDDTWNVNEKEWHRPETPVDAFEGIGSDEIQQDRETFNRPSGAGEDVPAAPRTIRHGR